MAVRTTAVIANTVSTNAAALSYDHCPSAMFGFRMSLRACP